MAEILAQLPDPEKVTDAICRVRLSYPRDWEPLLNEAAILEHFAGALRISVQKHRQVDHRARLGDAAAVEAMPPEELLAAYWRTIGLDGDEAEAMQHLAKEILNEVELGQT
jgi:exonuclease SbcD